MKKFTYWAEVAALGIVLGLVLQGAKAWTEPSAAPPGGNVGAPLNTSPIDQSKTGSLALGGLAVSGSALINGNLGIGTLSPQAKVDVAGGVKIGDSANCAANTSGTMRYNSGKIQYCNGTTWVDLGGGSNSYGNLIGSYVNDKGCYGSTGNGGGRIWTDTCWGAANCDPPNWIGTCKDGTDRIVTTFVYESHWGDGSWGQCVADLHFCIK